jgi:uncharacterized protein
MIRRHLEDKLRQVAKSYPVVTVTGPRQSGKTTLVKEVFRAHAYANLEAPDLREAALDDPRGFLARYPDAVILDEVQRAPELFSYIQALVDEDARPGRFILTGSQNFLLLERITQSLAGRAAVLHLMPFSQDELAGRPATPTEGLCRSRPGELLDERREDLMSVLFRGAFPPVHDRGLDPRDWFAYYVETYLSRDVRTILNVGDLDTFQRFLALVAGRSGQLLKLSSLASDADVTHTTARRWLSVLQASFLVTLLAPHHQSFNKRLVKSPKLYLLDTGLAAYLLGIRSPEELALHPLRGSLFETFVVSELFKRGHHQGERPRLYFWRDSGGREIDLIIDRGLDLLPIEIKSNQTLRSDQLRHLTFWRSLGAPASQEEAGLIYAGDQDTVFKGVRVLPWWRL